MIYKCRNDLALKYLCDLFNSNDSMHFYNTRNSSQLEPLNHTLPTITVSNLNLWNSLPRNIQESTYLRNIQESTYLGWTHISVRRKVCIIRFLNKIVSLDNSRLPRQLLEWDINCKGHTWSSDIKSLLSSIDQARAFQTGNMVCTKAAWACLHETYCNQYKIESLNKPKLRTYVKFKTCFKIEDC